MATEYRVEKQNSADKRWYLAYGNAGNFATPEAAENYLDDARAHLFSPSAQLRVASRQVSEWTPITTPLQRAITRLREVMISNGQLGYQDADVRLLIQAVERGA